jgi:hypothetical protein
MLRQSFKASGVVEMASTTSLELHPSQTVSMRQTASAKILSSISHVLPSNQSVSESSSLTSLSLTETASLKSRTAVTEGALLGTNQMVSIAINPATGALSITPRWDVAANLAGFHIINQDLNLGGGANNFYSIVHTPIPAGGDILAFTYYNALTGTATPHTDIGSKLTPDTYSALTSADQDVGYGAVNLYFIHHHGTTDYFSAIIPGVGVGSEVTDEKPMSGPGGPSTVTGVNGYFGLTFATANLGYGSNVFYYFRKDPGTGFTLFGSLAPALLALSADIFDLGVTGHNALAYTVNDVGFGTSQMYYLRLDPNTGFTIFGTLNPTNGRAADISNLGSLYSTITFTAADLGFGPGKFYLTGEVLFNSQSVSFAAIQDRAISAGSFTVQPSASSDLPIVLTLVSSSTATATISAPINGVYTITPTSPGVITLQATQAGAVTPVVYRSNMLQQSFTVSI